MPRDMMENERSTAINPGEAVEEKVSLSDRFGLWLGFHRCSQDEFLAMVEGYVDAFRLPDRAEELRARGAEWATTRGSRSGRVAWQYRPGPRGPEGSPAHAPSYRAAARGNIASICPIPFGSGLRSPAEILRGSTGVRPLRSSKCSCGEVTLPVCPALAMA